MTDIFGRHFKWELNIEQVQMVIHISATLSTSLYLETLEATLSASEYFESASVYS